MSVPSSTPAAGRIRASALLALLGLACLASSAAAAMAWTVPEHSGSTVSATLWTVPGLSRPTVSATLQQCLTAGAQSERSATFAGEMASVVGSARMEMRIDVAERPPDAVSYHMLSAPGLGVWRGSAPGVKVYRYLKQVTNLGGPGFYRGVVRFRWLSSRGRLLAEATLHTKRCEQPATGVPTTEGGAPAVPAPGA
jgi:hypothetical protein